MAILTFLLFLFGSPPEAFKGTILDPSGAAVPGARVEISRANFSRVAATDDAGAFVLEGVPDGSYSLRVSANGFDGYSSSIEIPADVLQLTLLRARERVHRPARPLPVLRTRIVAHA